MDRLRQDLQYALRTMVRAPAFTLAAVLSLGLGIGASTAIFTVLDAALLRPLPVAEPGRLMQLQLDRVTGVTGSYSYPHYVEIRDRATSFSGVLGHAARPLALQLGDVTEQADGAAVSGNFFDVLGLTPAAGRFFVAGEDVPGSPVDVVVVSHELWQQRLGGGADAIGSTIRLNGHPFTVIGVAPPTFRGMVRATQHQWWLPMSAFAALRQATWLTSPGSSWMNIYARLAPGATTATADAELAVLAPQLREAGVLGEEYRNFVQPGGRGLTWQVESLDAPFKLMMAAVLLVMLIACANVANLLLARVAGRGRELAVRLAVGGSRGRLARQLLTESLTLAFLAGTLGVLFALWMIEVLARWPTPMGTAAIDPNLDLRVLGFALLATAVTGVLFGVGPALRGSHADITPVLRNVGYRGGRGGTAARGALVVAQVALSLVLLVGAALLARTMSNLADVPLGYGARNALVASLELPEQGYDRPARDRFVGELLERTRSLPGVTAASITTTLPPTPAGSSFNGLVPESEHVPQGGIEADIATVDEQYFDVMELPIVAGRAFSAADDAGTDDVAIINESMARRYWPDSDPVGRRIFMDETRTESWLIVGVARDGKYRSLREEETSNVWRPARQAGVRYLTLVARTIGDPMTLAEPLRAQVRALDAGVPLNDVTTLERHIARATAEERMATQVAAGFSVAALLLAAIGLYGLLAYFVAQHRREVGIRMALGADRGDVLALVLRKGLGLAALGIAAGVPAALIGSRLVQSLMYGLTATDPVSYATAAIMLAVVATLAAVIPARRASGVDPMVALRQE